MNRFLAQFWIASFFTLALSFSSVALAHSGGLNSQGCHAGSQPYHCHRAQAQTEQFTPLRNPSNGKREVISGQITRVRDGDTFVVGNVPIRLAAVDCPENNTIGGQVATEFMSRYVGANRRALRKAQQVHPALLDRTLYLESPIKFEPKQICKMPRCNQTK